MRFAASAMRPLSSSVKPVVPITIALACLRCLSVPSGRVKSISTSAWAIAPRSPVILTGPACMPTSGLLGTSSATASLSSLSASTASISARPMRPPAPAMATFTLLGSAGGDHVAVQPGELAVLEEHRQLALLALPAAGPLAPEQVVPAIGVEDVVQQR